MTVTSRIASPLRCGLYGLLTGAVLSATAAVVIALPAANAAPQQCNTTVGQSTSQVVESYLDRHPDVKQELTAKAQAESPGSNNALLDYLNRHPDVRQALVTLANQCTS
jgi:hemophore-related protein